MNLLSREETQGLHLPATHREHSLRVLPEFRDSLREFVPASFEPFTTCQGREDIDQSLHHGFGAGLVKAERYLTSIQTHERAPWERA